MDSPQAPTPLMAKISSKKGGKSFLLMLPNYSGFYQALWSTTIFAQRFSFLTVCFSSLSSWGAPIMVGTKGKILGGKYTSDILSSLPLWLIFHGNLDFYGERVRSKKRKKEKKVTRLSFITQFKIEFLLVYGSLPKNFCSTWWILSVK